jgi:UPF0271 protein
MKSIDLNCDMGELPEAIADGTQEALMPSLTSVNIACGGHAGDEQTMQTTIEQALRWKLALGAHPGYPDRANFGRLELQMPAEAIADAVFEQVRALAKVAASGVARWSPDVVLMGLAGSPMLDVFREAGFAVAAEAFADRRYEPDGTLRSRKFDHALIRDPAEAGRQALSIVERGTLTACDGTEIALHAQTICIHGDTPGAPEIAAAVAHTLRQAGVALSALSRPAS